MRAMSDDLQRSIYAFLRVFTIVLLTRWMVLPVNAQVIPDGTLSTKVTTPNNLNFGIDGGVRTRGNLFHSFSQFSVPNGGSAVFNNALDVQNIFTRVTGGIVSNINGLIQANGSANLFLLNPSGIVFGKNASLNIGGSFIGTTASGIKFADGTEFAVNSTTPPLLTMSAPIGLQIGSSPGPIQVQGQGHDDILPTNNLGIVASPGKTIALVGGDITFTGGVITAPVGRIELGAVGSGTVSLTPTPAGWQLGYAQVADLRDINFTQRSSLWNPYPVGNPFGGIQVVGRDITLNQSEIAAATTGTGQGGDITVNAGRSLLLGGVNPNLVEPITWIANLVAKNATGNGGAVNIQAGNITLQDGATIETLSQGAGAAGNIQVRADTIALRGFVPVGIHQFVPFDNSNIISVPYASGAGGDITVVARKLTLEDGGLVTTTVFSGATGRGGNIFVDVADEIDAIGFHPFLQSTSSGINTYTYGIGNGGNVRVSTGTLNLLNGGTIYTLVTQTGQPGSGIGNAGDVTVVARKGINLVGASPEFPNDLSYLGSLTTGSGNSGNVTVTTPILSLQAGASLGTTTIPENDIILREGGPNNYLIDFGPKNNLGNSGNITLNVTDRLTISGINQVTKGSTVLGTNTYANGKAGDVIIHTNQLQILDGGSISTFTVATGNAGALTIQANDILVEGKNILPSSISASAPILDEKTRQSYNLLDPPTGNTGVLNINTHQLTVRNGADITVAHEGTGNAGQLNIQADRISLDTGTITARTASGKGGNINLVLKNVLDSRHDSQITATAGGSGNGGNITINSPIILGIENSDIIANAFQGPGGNIDITTQGIIGLQFRNTLTPRTDPTSDITASSQYNVNGDVQINNIGVDLNSGLVNLPTNLTDRSQQIAEGCSSNQGSSFVVTGRGGLPANPDNSVDSTRGWTDLRLSSLPTSSPTNSLQTLHPENPPVPETLIQATRWGRNTDGKVELYADASPVSPSTPGIATCAAPSGVRIQESGVGILKQSADNSMYQKPPTQIPKER